MNLRLLREERGWSQAELATAMERGGAGMYQTTISRIEKGERPVRLGEALGFSRVLQVPLASLIASPHQTGLFAQLTRAAQQVQRLSMELARNVAETSQARTVLADVILKALERGVVPNEGAPSMTFERQLAFAQHMMETSNPVQIATETVSLNDLAEALQDSTPAVHEEAEDDGEHPEAP